MHHDLYLEPHLRFPVAFSCRGWTTFDQHKVAFRFHTPALGIDGGCPVYLWSGSQHKPRIVNYHLSLACHTAPSQATLARATRLVSDMQVILAPWEPEFTLLHDGDYCFSWLEYASSLPAWRGKPRAAGYSEVFPLHVSFGRCLVAPPLAARARESFLRWFGGHPFCPLRHQHP
jgi:hypothetical protein